jgi:hypothetical protein
VSGATGVAVEIATQELSVPGKRNGRKGGPSLMLEKGSGGAQGHPAWLWRRAAGGGSGDLTVERRAESRHGWLTGGPMRGVRLTGPPWMAAKRSP